MFSLQQNQRTRGQNRFCLEVVGEGSGPNNVYTCKKWKNGKIKLRLKKHVKTEKKTS
jgi:hypothetical protein